MSDPNVGQTVKLASVPRSHLCRKSKRGKSRAEISKAEQLAVKHDHLMAIQAKHIIYGLVSGTNKGYGTHCEMTNVGLWAVEPVEF